MNHKELEELQEQERRKVSDQIHACINLNTHSQVPTYRDKNVAPNSFHMFQTKCYE